MGASRFNLPLLQVMLGRVFHGVILAVGGVVLVFAPVAAAGTPAIAQSFRADGDGIIAGVLVCSSSKSSNTVKLSKRDTSSDLVGVVAESPLVALGEDDASAKVVTSGVVPTLVSDINGDIKAGDKITASPIEGIGMKVTEPVTIVGTAQADLSSVQTDERTLRDRDGKEQSVKVGRIPVEVRVAFHTATQTQVGFVPEVLQNTANAIAGKPVSPVRVIASAVLIFLALLSVMVLVYSSVRSSIISIGRNPLSERAVHRSLFEVGATAIGILLLTFITIYLILVI